MSRENGFTLIELMAVMVMVSIIASVIVQKIYALDTVAKFKAINEAVHQLNSRELLTWTNFMFSPGGYTSDEDVFNAVDKDLGTDYTWSAGPTGSGGQLSFKTESVSLTRQSSTPVSAAKWQ
jgi:prepilin-type N-terminal cleavage/methylation domain-containing protein